MKLQEYLKDLNYQIDSLQAQVSAPQFLILHYERTIYLEFEWR